MLSLLWRRFKNHKLAFVSLIILIFLIFISIGAPLIESSLGVSHKEARLVSADRVPGWPHILGTNELGQDVFTRLIFGGRISLSVGIISALSSALIGAFIGLVAGFYGGRLDALLMRFTDAMLSVPVLPLMIVFAALDLAGLFSQKISISNIFLILSLLVLIFMIFRFVSDSKTKRQEKKYFWHLIFDFLLIYIFLIISYFLIFVIFPWNLLNQGNFASVTKLILIIIFFGWMTVARLARASALQIKNLEFVSAAQSLGASNSRIMLTHILPNALAPIIVAATLEVGANILYEASLSFLGLGIQPPVSSWGNMLNNAVEYIKASPMLAFWPGLFILVTVACFNFLGDGMRDALDPHQVLKRVK